MLQFLIPLAAGALGREIIQNIRSRRADSTTPNPRDNAGWAPNARHLHRLGGPDYRIQVIPAHIEDDHDGESDLAMETVWQGDSESEAVDALFETQRLYPEYNAVMERAVMERGLHAGFEPYRKVYSIMDIPEQEDEEGEDLTAAQMALIQQNLENVATALVEITGRLDRVDQVHVSTAGFQASLDVLEQSLESLGHRLDAAGLDDIEDSEVPLLERPGFEGNIARALHSIDQLADRVRALEDSNDVVEV